MHSENFANPTGSRRAKEECCAMKVLDGLTPNKNWAFLSLDEALISLEHRFSSLPSVDDFSCILHKCIKEKNRSYTLRLHAHLLDWGLDSHTSIGNPLVLALVGVRCMSAAQEVFDRLVHRQNGSWNSLISGYVQSGQPGNALTLYQSMDKDVSLQVSDYAFAALLKACMELNVPALGCKIHVDIVKKGLLESNVFVANALVDMYAKCCFLSEAQVVFDAIPVRDAVLWTALISGYAEFGFNMQALSCLEEMQQDGFSPDATTFVCSLKACKGAGIITRGEELFAEVVGRGLEEELLVGNILVDMYAKWGLFAEAHMVFDSHRIRSVVSWNVLMTAYEEHGYYEETVNCFDQMQKEDFAPDIITFVCCLKACSSIGLGEKGQEIHVDIVQQGLEKEIVVGSALVDMYAKCSSLLEARDVFDKLEAQDVVSWTALIAGHAQCGQTEEACDMFDRMTGSGIRPDFITFVSLMMACNHSGLLENGELCLDFMCKAYGVMPVRKHYNCLIDLFGRAGLLHKVVVLIQKMPFHPGIVVWHTVLSACQRWLNVELGRLAFKHTIQVDQDDAGAYVCMSNIYASAGMQEDAHKIEVMGLERLAGQRAGSSWWEESQAYFGE